MVLSFSAFDEASSYVDSLILSHESEQYEIMIKNEVTTDECLWVVNLKPFDRVDGKKINTA